MPALSAHAVHIYAESDDLVVHLSGIVASSLVLGNPVVIIATAEHQQQLVHELLNVGIDVPRYTEAGLFSMRGAEQTLASFMINGMPDANLFHAALSAVIRNVRESTRSSSKLFTFFGEMVALLWDQGNQAAALRLEELWNELLNEVPIRLHCGYPKRAFNHVEEINAVCRLHSSVLHIGGSATPPTTFAAD